MTLLLVTGLYLVPSFAVIGLVVWAAERTRQIPCNKCSRRHWEDELELYSDGVWLCGICALEDYANG